MRRWTTAKAAGRKTRGCRSTPGFPMWQAFCRKNIMDYFISKDTILLGCCCSLQITTKQIKDDDNKNNKTEKTSECFCFKSDCENNEIE
jgi:hypothetical protein